MASSDIPSSSTPPPPPPPPPPNLIFLAKKGDVAGVASALRNPLLDPNASGPDDGDTALIASVVKGHIEVTALLLADKRVNPNAANEHGITPLMLSACRKLPPIFIRKHLIF